MCTSKALGKMTRTHVLALLLLAGGLASISVAYAETHEQEERLIGWQGDTYKPKARTLQPWVSHISWKPRAFIFRNFLTDEEAQHIVDQAWPRMQRSTVVGQNGSSVLDDYRTSYGTFLSRYHDNVLARVQNRVALFTHTPVIHQEDMQVLRYGVGQYYHKHLDSLEDESPRMATLLLYLNDPLEGGETSFPDGSEWLDPEMAEQLGPFSKCAQGHVAFKPRRGDGLLFWSMRPASNIEDKHSMHEGCPVIKGAKWTATVWIHSKPFRPEDWDGRSTQPPEQLHDPGICRDQEERCREWAASGECDRNPVYMHGSCAKSCKRCRDCKEGDIACYNDNRQQAGYLVYNPQDMDSSLVASAIAVLKHEAS